MKGRKRHVLVNTLGLPFASRVEPAWAASPTGLLAIASLAACALLFPTCTRSSPTPATESRKLARQLKSHDGYTLQVVKQRQRAFRIAGLTWIGERSIAWLSRYRRLSKDYEFKVQSSATIIDLAAIRLMLNRLAPT